MVKAYNMNTIGDYLEIHDAVFKAEVSSEGGITSLSLRHRNHM